MFCEKMKTKFFSGSLISTKCENCGCSWKDHLPIIYKYVDEEENLIDEITQQKFWSTSDSIESKQILLSSIETTVEELTIEKIRIEEIGSMFAYFLNVNSTFVSF